MSSSRAGAQVTIVHGDDKSRLCVMFHVAVRVHVAWLPEALAFPIAYLDMYQQFPQKPIPAMLVMFQVLA